MPAATPATTCDKNVSVPVDTLLANYARERELARHRRGARREAIALRPEIAQLLVEQHAKLAIPGRAGLFSAWLHQHRIAHTTAYRIIARYAALGVAAKSTVLNDISCAVRQNALPAPGEPQWPGLAISRQDLRLDHPPIPAACTYLTLDASQERPHQYRGSRVAFDPAEEIIGGLVHQVTDPRVLQKIRALENTPDHLIPQLDPFAPAIRIRDHA